MVLHTNKNHLPIIQPSRSTEYLTYQAARKVANADHTSAGGMVKAAPEDKSSQSGPSTSGLRILKSGQPRRGPRPYKARPRKPKSDTAVTTPRRSTRHSAKQDQVEEDGGKGDAMEGTADAMEGTAMKVDGQEEMAKDVGEGK